MCGVLHWSVLAERVLHALALVSSPRDQGRIQKKRKGGAEQS